MSTILAVDDSATMRKCLEITFAGTEFNLITCGSAEEALEKVKTLSPALVIADVSLPPKDGYDLCSTIKLAQPHLPVLMLSSKQSPFDSAKGGQADGHVDKPFDTQVLQDRARELIKAAPAEAAERVATASPKPPVAVSMPERAPSSKIPAPRRKRPTPAMMVKPPIQTPTPGVQRATGQQAMRRTVPFAMPGGSKSRGAQAMVDAMRKVGTQPMDARRDEGRKPMSDTLPGAHAGEPPAAAVDERRAEAEAESLVARGTAPAPGPGDRAGVTAVAGSAGVPARADGAPVATIPRATMASLEDRLGQLGLTREQMEGVLSLSRDLVEQVVWEVVPVLAETLIKEEIARLTKA